MSTIAEILRAAAIDPADARVLLRFVLGASDAQLATHPERVVTAAERERFLALAVRRRAGEPVAYLTGEREFYSLPFKVTAAVLIPRPETELLVETALEWIAVDAPVRVLDLATGSGCVAIAIARHRARAHVTAVDVSPAALAVARENAKDLGVGVEFIESDWFAALAGRRFDFIVANPPYVAEGDPHLESGDLRFEPRNALVAGIDGLTCIRVIVGGAAAHLDDGGSLLFEHGFDQAAGCRNLLQIAGFQKVASWRDLAGIERISGGCRRNHLR
ncbi:MAG TPA: peptide chain release factor N(5)-glutamine methyltransferase [Burkholderiales bacterium]|nr:peptide chain release factor N(5)-glutamine methyltransferase [Burkholderiales bacterium]